MLCFVVWSNTSSSDIKKLKAIYNFVCTIAINGMHKENANTSLQANANLRGL